MKPVAFQMINKITRRPGRLLNILCTFNLRPVSTGYVIEHLHGLQDLPSGDCTYPLALSHSHVTLAKVP